MRVKLPTSRDVVSARKRIRAHVDVTPVFSSPVVDEIAGANLLIKAECLQQTGSFKIRGATNRLLQIPKKRRDAGVVAFSSGNHAQGVARAARLLGMPALIVMPSDAPTVKTEGVEADGAEVRLYDRDNENREEIAAEIARERGATLVPSFDDPMIIAGQGTVGLELVEQVKARDLELDHLICCTGGGGLISGIALALSKVSPETRIWTAEPEDHDDWKRSLESGSIQSNAPGTRSKCDAILTPQPGRSDLGSGLAFAGRRVRDFGPTCVRSHAHCVPTVPDRRRTWWGGGAGCCFVQIAGRSQGQNDRRHRDRRQC